MATSRYCRDYGGTLGLTCGYWAKHGSSIDRHVLNYHSAGEEVYDIDRSEDPRAGTSRVTMVGKR